MAVLSVAAEMSPVAVMIEVGNQPPISPGNSLRRAALAAVGVQRTDCGGIAFFRGCELGEEQAGIDRGTECGLRIDGANFRRTQPNGSILSGGGRF